VLATTSAMRPPSPTRTTASRPPDASPTSDQALDAITLRVDTSDRVASTITPAEARWIARDVLDDLATIEQAQRERAPALLRTAASESRLAELTEQLTDGMARDSVTVESYRIDRIVISIARRVGQAAPAIMVTLNGHLDISTIGDASSGGVRSEPLRQSYEVKQLGRRYLITTDDLPPGFQPPA